MLASTNMMISGFEPEKIHKDAIRILNKIGLEVSEEKIRQRVNKRLLVKGKRVFFEKRIIEDFVEKIRKAEVQNAKPNDRKLTIGPSSLSFYFIDPQTQEIKPYDTKTLSSFTRLVSSLSEEGIISGGIPGYPSDIRPFPLQIITQYYIDCCYNKRPHCPMLVYTPEIMRFIMEMAKVMEHQIGIGVEPISPLKFAGTSINLALEFFSEEPYIGLDPMPMMGISAPLDWDAAWSQSVAVNLGSYIIFRVLGFKKVSPPSFRLFPASMLSAIIWFGSPQYFMALLTKKKIREFYNLSPGGADSMLTLAKVPGPQASIEKSVQTVLAAMAGFRGCGGAGTLAIDEIFSPQQLMIDIEIRDYVENISKEYIEYKERGIKDTLQLIEEGLKGDFLGSETTLNNWKSFYWIPTLFDQTTRSRWQESKKKILNTAWDLAEERIKKCDYELVGEKRTKLDKIMFKAKNTFVR